MSIRSAAIVAALAGLLARPVLAHIVADPSEGEAGRYFRTTLRVGHGCKGSATTALRIALPEGMAPPKVEAKPGWSVKVEPGAVTWTGGPLPDWQFAEFGLLFKLPDAPATLWFPAVQTCEQGEVRWTQIPAEGTRWGALPTPAPFVRVRAGTAAPAGHHAH